MQDLFFKYKVTPNKKYGQNFLIDEKAISDFIEIAKPKGKVVLEIGPGLGFITTKLLQSAKKVIAIEIDKKLYDALRIEFREYIESGKLVLIRDDVLDCNIEKIIKEHKIEKIISAPPYYISTDIMYMTLKLDIKEAYFIFQKDFIEKVRNDVFYSPSALSVVTYYYSKPEFLEDVPASSFHPIPKVVSQIIKLKIKSNREFDGKDEDRFVKIVKEIFRYPNKSLRKCMLYSKDSLKDKESIKMIDFALENAPKELLESKIIDVGGKEFVELFG